MGGRVRGAVSALGAMAVLAACSGSGRETAVTTTSTGSTSPSAVASSVPSSTAATTTPGPPTTTTAAGPLALALDLESGQERWRQPLLEGPLAGQVVGDVLVVRTCSSGEISAVTLASGAPRWTTPVACGASFGVWANEDVAVAQTDDAVVGISLDGGARRWQLDLPAPSAPASVVGANGTAIAPTGPSGLVAVDAATGSKRWQVEGPSGLLTLAVADQVVVAANMSEVVAFDLATGAERWRKPLSSAGGLNVQVAGDLILVTDLHLDPAQPASGGAAAEIVALDASTGAERWRHARQEALLPAGPAVSDPVSGTIAVGWSNIQTPGSGSAEGLGPDGAVRWSVESFAPLAAADGTVVGSTLGDPASANASVIAVDARTGQERWRLASPAGQIIGATAGGGTAVVGTTGADQGPPADQVSTVTALSPSDGSQRWQVETAGVASVLPPAITGGVVAVVVCPPDGSSKVVALDVTSGETTWEHAGPSCGAGGFLPVLVIGDGLLAAATGDGVAGIDARDGHERWAAKLGGVPRVITGDATGLVADIDGKLTGLDPASGKQRWQLDVGLAPLPATAASGLVVVAEPQITANPIVTIRAYDALTGKERWRRELPAIEAQGTPVGDVVVVSYAAPQSQPVPANPELVGLDARTGSDRWRLDRSAFGPVLPLVTPNTFVTTLVGSDPSGPDPVATALGPAGQTLWTASGMVAGAAGGGLVLATAFDGSALIALDAASGKERWRSTDLANVGSVAAGADAVVSVFTPGGSD